MTGETRIEGCLKYLIWVLFYWCTRQTTTLTDTSSFLLTYKHQSLSLSPSNRHRLLPQLIEGTSRRLLVLVNGDPSPPLCSSQTVTTLTLLSPHLHPSFLSCSNWFNGIDHLHLLTSLGRIYRCSCPNLNACWLLLTQATKTRYCHEVEEGAAWFVATQTL